ncbi:hypothetical protein M139_0127 [Bacteroides fragilis str. S23L24]|nr:hypothetical protein M139_0127 [Bacteroides fragilis str. S23L24]EYA87906.1 hypothetical protein M137_0243 [Bacteroides fragilis str. S36L12]
MNNPITESGAIIPFSITFGLSGSQILYLNSVIVLYVIVISDLDNCHLQIYKKQNSYGLKR